MQWLAEKNYGVNDRRLVVQQLAGAQVRVAVLLGEHDLRDGLRRIDERRRLRCHARDVDLAGTGAPDVAHVLRGQRRQVRAGSTTWCDTAGIVSVTPASVVDDAAASSTSARVAFDHRRPVGEVLRAVRRDHRRRDGCMHHRAVAGREAHGEPGLVAGQRERDAQRRRAGRLHDDVRDARAVGLRLPVERIERHRARSAAERRGRSRRRAVHPCPRAAPPSSPAPGAAFSDFSVARSRSSGAASTTCGGGRIGRAQQRGRRGLLGDRGPVLGGRDGR